MNTCKLCGEPLNSDTGYYDWEDAKGWVWEICSVCKEELEMEVEVA